MRGLNTVDWVAIVLVIVGAINWGLVGLFDFNLVDSIFGAGSALSRIIYTLVGLAGLYTIYLASRQPHASRHETVLQH
jgi:uncharacterized membrane protein YuzA (DUF378 family)